MRTLTRPPHQTPFIGWHRSIPQVYIERVIRLGVAGQLSRFDLRVWCALAEIKTDGSLPMERNWELCIHALIEPEDSPICLSFQRRRRKIYKSWDKLFAIVGDQCGYRRPETEDSFWVKVPRLLLRYLARFGTRAELLIALLACCRSLRNRRYQFRFHQARFAQEVGLSRETVSKALSRLRQAGMIKRLSSWPGAIKKYGQLYQWTMVKNEKQNRPKALISSHLNQEGFDEKALTEAFRGS